MQLNHQMMLSNSNDKRFSTEPLDEAMKELIDVCQQYNDKFARQQPPAQSNPLTKSNSKFRTSPIMSYSYNDKTNQHVNNAATKCDNATGIRRFEDDASSTCPTQPGQLDKSMSGSIEKLQQRQGELQSQLDQVLEVAKNLESKQKRQLNNLLTDQAKASQATRFQLDEDEDSELIEFQQIENELRISELNRQLSNIQEELRLRLYKRLLSKTSNGTKSTKERQQHQPAAFRDQEPATAIRRRNSAQTDESTPPSSSCSDEHTVSSSISNSDTINSRMYADGEPADLFERCGGAYKRAENVMLSSSKESADQTDSETTTPVARGQSQPDKANATPASTVAPRHSKGAAIHDLASALNQPNYEVPKPSTSNGCGLPPSRASTPSHNQQAPKAPFSSPNEEQQVFQLMSSCYTPNGLRNCAATNDLERIEEGEEEEQNEYYSNSSMFRKIYEEKLSPLLQAGDSNRSHSSSSNHDSTLREATYENVDQQQQQQQQRQDETGQSQDRTPECKKDMDDYRFSMSNVNSARRGANRPLTMYLPKPDEDIDLVEMVQAMGHDLAIVSDDLRLAPATAHGYLYKLCANNSKKWLKRFFAFDRNLKSLAYFESEEQLVRKSGTPKCVIPFDEIGDVYVDHRLSELSEKQRGFKRKSYVFILATTKRKYVLASPRAETMRAWIDILFTAAKANDYFQQFVGGADEASAGYPADCLDF